MPDPIRDAVEKWMEDEEFILIADEDESLSALMRLYAAGRQSRPTVADAESDLDRARRVRGVPDNIGAGPKTIALRDEFAAAREEGRERAAKEAVWVAFEAENELPERWAYHAIRLHFGMPDLTVEEAQAAIRTGEQ